jgi:hypothetical protein
MDNIKLRKSLEELGADVVAEVVSKLLEANKDSTGDLIRSISYQILETSNGLLLNILASDYFKYVDQGRRPGGKQPPPDKILGWVRTKGISFGRNSIDFKPEQIAFLIGRSIQRKGIKPTNIKQKVIDDILNKKEYIIQSGVKLDIQNYIKKEIFK